MQKKPSIAKASLRFTGIFEAELLLALMLREWKHPLANDQDFQAGLLESAAEILRASIKGEKLLEELSPDNVNLVAAICIAEATTVGNDRSLSEQERTAREAWVAAVRRSVPSCFCNPELLP
jgi:hypothetical protein